MNNDDTSLTQVVVADLDFTIPYPWQLYYDKRRAMFLYFNPVSGVLTSTPPVESAEGATDAKPGPNESTVSSLSFASFLAREQQELAQYREKHRRCKEAVMDWLDACEAKTERADSPPHTPTQRRVQKFRKEKQEAAALTNTVTRHLYAAVGASP